MGSSQIFHSSFPVLKKPLQLESHGHSDHCCSSAKVELKPLAVAKNKSNSISTNDSAMDSGAEDDLEGPTGNSNIEKLLTLKYQPCREIFSDAFLAENKIEPDWKAAKISGQEYYEGYLMKLGYKGNIPSSFDYTVYNIQRTSSKR